MTLTTPARLTRRGDLIGFVPYVLGFHPSDSVVLIGLQKRRITFGARADADWPTSEIVRQFARTLTHQPRIDSIMLLGYGADELVTATTIEVSRALAGGGHQVRESLRVTGDRYFCLQCDQCTPAGGSPFDIDSGVGAAYAVFEGLVAQPDRASIERRVQPIGGLAQVAMAQATDRAEERLAELLTTAADPGGTLLKIGKDAIDEALALARDGVRLDDEQAAWLSVLLLDLPCRDHAWLRCDGGADWQLQLWLDLTRRCEPLLVAPIATLLAWCAWRGGDGVLAATALERALRTDPGYSLAKLLMDALSNGVPPGSVGTWPARRRGRRSRRREGSS